jgi:divalent metal cation (Fe/Co/Zn/Cd) transporter
VALAGLAATRWLGWHWADAVAAIVVGAVALTLALRLAIVSSAQRTVI